MDFGRRETNMSIKTATFVIACITSMIAPLHAQETSQTPATFAPQSVHEADPFAWLTPLPPPWLESNTANRTTFPLSEAFADTGESAPPDTTNRRPAPATNAEPLNAGTSAFANSTLRHSSHKPHHNTGFVDFNTYWDDRDLAITTINILANLPADIQYFQLLNMYSHVGSGTTDWSGYFTEMNLRRPIQKDNPYLTHLDWSAQYADGNIARGNLRLGLRWRMQDTPGPLGAAFKDVLKLNYAVTFYAIETDGTGWQIEQVYRRNFLDGKVYMGGFCDHNINNSSRNSAWVTEHQFGVRLFDSAYAVAEYRYNSYFPAGSRSGLGVGLEYVMRFK